MNALRGPAAVTAIATFVAVAAFAAEPTLDVEPEVATATAFGGRWHLEPERSSFAGGVPQSMVVVIEPRDAALRYRSDTTHANGIESHAEFEATLNGDLALQTGAAGLLAPVQLKRIDEYTIDARYIRGLRVVASSRWKVDPAEGRLSVTTTSEGADGVSQRNVAVFHRVENPVGEPASAGPRHGESSANANHS